MQDRRFWESSKVCCGSYNAAGRNTSLTAPEGTTTFSYDNDNQLTGATGSAQPTQSYTYDSNGNRIAAITASGSNSYVTNTDNELASDGTYNYTYDHEGNLITRTTIAAGDTVNYTWDYRNRLTGITDKWWKRRSNRRLWRVANWRLADR